MTKTDDSLLNTLAHHTARLRRFRPDDCDPHFLPMLDNPSPAEIEFRTTHAKQRMAESMNRSFDRLFPGGEPVTAAHVKDLIGRFREATEATDRDRNRVRAHRYERGFDESYRQDLAEVEQQVGVFEQYLGDLYLVLTKSAYLFRPPVFASVERTASDVADLIVLGSINKATFHYGVVGREPLERDRLYWLKRQQFYGEKEGE